MKLTTSHHLSQGRRGRAGHSNLSLEVNTDQFGLSGSDQSNTSYTTITPSPPLILRIKTSLSRELKTPIMWLLLQVRLSFVESRRWGETCDGRTEMTNITGDTVSTSSHYQVITVKTIWFWNNNFPPQEKFQLPLEFENNKVNHDLRFFFNKPVWCSWTFPVKNQTQTHQLLEPLLSIEVTWLWLKFIVRIERKPQQRLTLRRCKWWLNIPAQVGVRIQQTGAGGSSYPLSLSTSLARMRRRERQEARSQRWSAQWLLTGAEHPCWTCTIISSHSVEERSVRPAVFRPKLDKDREEMDLC